MPQLEAIIGKWIVPKALIQFMKTKGVNIFPDEDSRKYVMNSYKVRDSNTLDWMTPGVGFFPQKPQTFLKLPSQCIGLNDPWRGI